MYVHLPDRINNFKSNQLCLLLPLLFIYSQIQNIDRFLKHVGVIVHYFQLI